MKRNFRYLVFLALIIATFFGTSNLTRSASAKARIPDPACVSSCTFELSLCLRMVAKTITMTMPAFQFTGIALLSAENTTDKLFQRLVPDLVRSLVGLGLIA